jgi:GAF domain-containing protein
MPTREDRLLQTVATLADSLVGGFDVVDLLQLLVDECTVLFDAAAAGILLRSPAGELEVIVSTSERSEFVGLMQLRVGEGPCVQAVTTGHVVSVPDLSHVAHLWPAFATTAQESGFGSIHAVPMRLRESTIGSLNLFRDRHGELNEPDAVAAQVLADIATISILQQRIAEQSALTQAQLQHALDSRVVIEQAKGFVAQSRGCSMNEAFELMRTHARSHRARLGAVAADVIEGRLVL